MPNSRESGRAVFEVTRGDDTVSHISHDESDQSFSLATIPELPRIEQAKRRLAAALTILVTQHDMPWQLAADIYGCDADMVLNVQQVNDHLRFDFALYEGYEGPINPEVNNVTAQIMAYCEHPWTTRRYSLDSPRHKKFEEFLRGLEEAKKYVARPSLKDAIAQGKRAAEKDYKESHRFQETFPGPYLVYHLRLIQNHFFDLQASNLARLPDGRQQEVYTQLHEYFESMVTFFEQLPNHRKRKVTELNKILEFFDTHLELIMEETIKIETDPKDPDHKARISNYNCVIRVPSYRGLELMLKRYAGLEIPHQR